MAAVAFDTLKLSRTLREKAKLSPEQAEGFADALSEAVQNDLATRSDLTGEIGKLRTEMTSEFAKVRTEMTSEFAKVRTEMTSEFAKVRTEIDLLRSEMKTEVAVAKADLLKWSIGQTLVILGAMLALIRFAGHF